MVKAVADDVVEAWSLVRRHVVVRWYVDAGKDVMIHFSGAAPAPSAEDEWFGFPPPPPPAS